MRSPVLPIFFYIKFSGFFIDSLNQLEILPTLTLVQETAARICPEIVGIAKGKEEALELITDMVQTIYEETGELNIKEFGQDDPSSRGAQVSTALNLLSNFMREIDDSELYLKVAQLKTLAERGVITYISKRLQRIQKDLRRVSGKARMTHDEALNEIIQMANKYAPYYMAEAEMLKQIESEAEIILSESFKEA